MAKPRRRVVPVRRVRFSRESGGWELVKQIDLPPTVVPPSADAPPGGGVWAEAVDRHEELVHRVVLETTVDDVIDVVLPIDSRAVTLNLYDGKPSSEPVASIDLTGAGSGAPGRASR